MMCKTAWIVNIRDMTHNGLVWGREVWKSRLPELPEALYAARTETSEDMR